MNAQAFMSLFLSSDLVPLLLPRSSWPRPWKDGLPVAVEMLERIGGLGHLRQLDEEVVMRTKPTLNPWVVLHYVRTAFLQKL